MNPLLLLQENPWLMKRRADTLGPPCKRLTTQAYNLMGEFGARQSREGLIQYQKRAQAKLARPCLHCSRRLGASGASRSRCQIRALSALALRMCRLANMSHNTIWHRNRRMRTQHSRPKRALETKMHALRTHSGFRAQHSSPQTAAHYHKAPSAHAAQRATNV
jgi:hypothetical protein